MRELLESIITLCREAGQEIMVIYEGNEFDVEAKEDESPLTAADLASHRTLVTGLSRIAAEIPVLSEESDGIPWPTRRDWDRYFLVDPLDGTKEFLGRNGEFTVNVALISNHEPVLGVVFVPASDVLYAGIGEESPIAFVERDRKRSDIRTRQLGDRLAREKPLTVVASRRHGSDALKDCMARLEENFAAVETENMGSSLKFCLVAEGKADFYPRLAPTSEWDTAAAQAIVEAAGGSVVDTAFHPLRYNTKEDILNPHFYVLGDTAFDWQAILN